MQQLTTYHLPSDTSIPSTTYHLTGWISSREVGVPDLLDTLRLTSTIRLDAVPCTSWLYLAIIGYNRT